MKRLALALAALALLAGACGSGRESAQQILADTSANLGKIKSGDLAMELTFSAKGGKQAGFSLERPFEAEPGLLAPFCRERQLHRQVAALDLPEVGRGVGQDLLRALSTRATGSGQECQCSQGEGEPLHLRRGRRRRLGRRWLSGRRGRRWRGSRGGRAARRGRLFARGRGTGGNDLGSEDVREFVLDLVQLGLELFDRQIGISQVVEPLADLGDAPVPLGREMDGSSRRE